MLRKCPRDGSPLLPDDERCTRNDGKKWRCRHRRAAGHSFCDCRFQYQRNKDDSLKMLREGDSKSNFSRKDEVKSGMKSRRPVNLKSTTEEPSSTKRSDLGQIVENEINMNKKPSERKRISIIPSKEWISYFGSDDKSDGEENNDIDRRVGEKRKSVSLEKVEKIENRGKQISDLSGTEYQSDGEEENDMNQRVGEKRKSISLEKVDKIENNGKQISDLSGIEYKSSTKKGLDSKEKLELSKKIFKGEDDPQTCNQCQQNDEGRVISCMACMKNRFRVPCIKSWQNPMDSDTETRKEENRTLSDLELEITQLETEIHKEKLRYDHLQTENDIYKNERLNLKKIIAVLEKEKNKFWEREEQNLSNITKLFGTMRSYDEKLAEFMKKHGGENNSLRKGKDTIVVKKEIEDTVDDEMLEQIKDSVSVGGDVGEDDNMVVKWSKKRVIKEMWRRLNSSASALMPYQHGRAFFVKNPKNLSI